MVNLEFSSSSSSSSFSSCSTLYKSMLSRLFCVGGFGCAAANEFSFVRRPSLTDALGQNTDCT